MAGKNYYLLSFLPAPGPLGAEPPILCADYLAHLRDTPHARRLAEAILLSDDLLQRDAVLAGELETPEPVVLDANQVRDEAPLPDVLAAPAEDQARKIASDVVWEAYFRHAARVAEQTGSPFLRAWVDFEVGLRNAVAQARARALELEPGDYLLAEDLAESTAEDFTATINEWSTAANPLAGQRALDQARRDWLDENDAYFSFGPDELAAYAAKLMLAVRWHRLTQEQEKHTDA